MAKVLIGNFKGPKGDQGVKGDPGTAATIQVGTTQTVQPEENAEVTNSGTANAAVLNFKIPRGADGMTDLVARYEDASEYTATPTADAPIVINDLNGKTQQTQTNGYQLFDASKLPSKTQGGVTITNNGDGSFTISGSGELSSDYLLSYSIPESDILKLFKPGDISVLTSQKTRPNFGFIIGSSNGTTQITNAFANTEKKDISNVLEGSGLYANISFYERIGSTIIPGTIKPMLYQDGDGTWEPYTGGSPTPSPDYPQVIKGVGGMGYFDGEWVQGNISSTGTVGTETTGITSANAIPCKQNDNIAVTYEDSIDVIAIAFYNASGAYISTSTSGNSVDTFTATAPANAASFKVNLRVVSGSTITPSTAKYCTVTVNGEYQTGVESRTAQLFDASKLPSKTQGGATVTNNGDGSFTISGSGNASENVVIRTGDLADYFKSALKPGKLKINASITNPAFYVNIYYQENGERVLKQLKSNGTLEIDLIDENISAITSANIGFTCAINASINPGTIRPMLYQDGDGTWQPYHHTALSIPLTAPLYDGDKICYVKPGESYVDADGTTVVADRILYGVYRENAIKKLTKDIVNSTSGGVVTTNDIIDGRYTAIHCKNYINIINKAIYNNNTLTNGKCNIARPGKISDWNVSSGGGSNIYTINDAGAIYIATDISFLDGITTSSSKQEVDIAVKNFVENNDVWVTFKIAQPYFEPFTDQSIFYNLRTDDMLTYIYSSDPIEPVLTVEVAKNSTGGYLLESYAQAQKNAISEASSQSRLSAIEQQLVNQATAPTE